MARNSNHLLNLDVDKLFEDRKIGEIIEIEKLLDSEIERKRVDLRSMVGDRYKDVLTASDAIKTMKTISESIVSSIDGITQQCETLLKQDVIPPRKTSKCDDKTREERTLVMQINLSLSLNEQIWVALDQDDTLKATQLYLLAQHIHTGLSLTRKEILDGTPIINQIKFTLSTLKDVILSRIKEKLESVEITAQETSNNLNALMLIKNLYSQDLLSVFIDHRKTALNTVIKSSHSSVRFQMSAMVRCLITTIHLLHDCFVDADSSKKGLIWQQLDEITNEDEPPVISKVELPMSYLIDYIPDVVKEFRLKLKTQGTCNSCTVIEDWLQSTCQIVDHGLKNSLELITNIKGLYIIREEALKIEPPEGWVKICSKIKLPENFSVWYYFFQALITKRAKELIVTRLTSNLEEIEKDIESCVNKSLKSQVSEVDLRSYVWTEEDSDLSRNERKHTGLSMKTKGFSPHITSLTQKIDNKYADILTDVSQYLYGVEYGELRKSKLPVEDFKFKRKFIDKEELEHHLTHQCASLSSRIADFVRDYVKNESKPEFFLAKSIMCARFLQAVTELCPHFTHCCSVHDKTEVWNKVCEGFSKTGIQLWSHWLDDCVKEIQKSTNENLTDISPRSIIKMLVRWDTIEIQEQADERVFTSHIKVPLKPSIGLHNILSLMNQRITCVLPHTLPKSIHIDFIQRGVEAVFIKYEALAEMELNQNQALQFLFDVKFLTTFCIPRDNMVLVSKSQNICDKMRAKIDPFDLDVFYSYVQSNVKKAVLQSQVIFGCLLPSSSQFANLGLEKMKEQDKEPSLLALSAPSTSAWFPLLPITAPSQKIINSVTVHKENKMPVSQKPTKLVSKKSQDAANVMKSGAAALFGGFTSDWFS